MRNKLFCKPVEITHESELLYCKYQDPLQGTISFRSLQLSADIDMIYDWVNQPYSKRFWGLNKSRDLINETYETMLKNPLAHSFIGLFNDIPVCQVDIYAVAIDELQHHVESHPDDCGLHLLMAPPKQLQKNMSLHTLRCFLDFYFSFPMAQHLYAEPDRDNILANRLAVKAGFRCLRMINLSYKLANLWCINRKDFLSKTNR